MNKRLSLALIASVLVSAPALAAKNESTWDSDLWRDTVSSGASAAQTSSVSAQTPVILPATDSTNKVRPWEAQSKDSR